MSDPIYRTAAWRDVRRFVLERDGHRCQLEGPTCTGRAEAVDHIVPWRHGGAWYDPENLRASCTQCNSRRVSGRAEAKPSREW